MHDKRYGWLRFALSTAGCLSQLLGLYVSAYFSTVTLGPLGEPVPHYGDLGEFHLAAEVFFIPIHVVDRAVRPEMWDTSAWDISEEAFRALEKRGPVDMSPDELPKRARGAQ